LSMNYFKNGGVNSLYTDDAWAMSS
jgi:hypothetical protein